MHCCDVLLVLCVCVTPCCPLHRLQIADSTKPVRLSQKLDKAVTNNFKPVSNHLTNVREDTSLHHAKGHPIGSLGRVLTT